MTSQTPQGWSAANSSVEPLEPGDPSSIGGLRLLGRLGEGGMAVVYLGLARSGRKVAVKVISRELARDPEYRARFDSEVVNAQRVASFCTVRVLDHGEADGLPYLVTEYIDGPSLADYVEEHGGFPADALRSLAVGVATALTAIHAVRLVHRDLKPRNVLLAADGPRVIDFGVARALDSEDHHTRTGAVLGSPGYLAPEQAFEGQLSPASDVFAWGTLVAHAANGGNPFGTGTPLALATRAQQAEYDLSGVPQDLLPIVQAALDPDPAQRPSAEDLLVRLVGEQDPQEVASDLIHDQWRPGPIPPADPPSAAPPADPPGPVASAAPPASPGAASETEPQRSPRGRTWGVAAVASVVTALVVLGVTSAAVYARDSGSDSDQRLKPRVTAPTPTVSPSPSSGSPTPSRSSSSPRRSGKADTKPRKPPTPKDSPKRKVTRPTKHWRDLGGLHRMAPYCAKLGYQEKVAYTEGGRKWWCVDSGDGLHRIDIQASCRWHYPSYDTVRARQRPSTGPPYEVDTYCEALV